MSVKPIEFPKGSGRWHVRVNWKIAPGTPWRKTKLIGIGEKARDAAIENAKLLNDAWKKYGVGALKLFETPAPDKPEEEEKPEVLTVKKYGETFIARMKAAGLKRTTLNSYESNLKHHIYPSLGEVDITTVDYTILANFLAAKATCQYSTGRFRTRKPTRKYQRERPPGTMHTYSRDAIRLMAMTLRAMMTEAVREKIVSINPVAGLARFYAKKRKDREVTRADVYTVEELHRTEEKLLGRDPEYFEFSLAMSREGMRIGEAIALLMTDVDFGRGTVLINKNVPTGTGLLEDSAKTDASDREIEFWSADFRTSLEAMVKRRRAEYFARGKPVPEFLFCEASGERIDYSTFLKSWNRAQAAAGVRQRPPHALRHTWASQMIAAGEDIASVSKHLGHANPGITLTLYTHFVPRKRRLIGTVLDRKNATETQLAGKSD